MASIGIGALGEPAIAHVFEPLLGGALGHMRPRSPCRS